MRKLLLLLFFIVIGTTAKAQFFQGWGFFVGATDGRQVLKINEPKLKDKSKYLLRYNAEVFAEFGARPFCRWVTEVQYNVKGAKWEYPSEDVKSVNQYIAWNNYFMYRYEMVSIIPYAKIGPRMEYVFNSDSNFNRFHVTGAVGAGIEMVPYGKVGFITELFWVPDLTHSYKDSFGFVNQHCWELRVGLKFHPGTGAESCPGVYR